MHLPGIRKTLVSVLAWLKEAGYFRNFQCGSLNPLHDYTGAVFRTISSTIINIHTPTHSQVNNITLCQWTRPKQEKLHQYTSLIMWLHHCKTSPVSFYFVILLQLVWWLMMMFFNKQICKMYSFWQLFLYRLILLCGASWGWFRYWSVPSVT